MDALIKIIIPILCTIESSNNPKAIGDGGKAVGILQIHTILVDDCNRLDTSSKRQNYFTYDDRKKVGQSKLMCEIILRHYGAKVKGQYTELAMLCRLGRIWNDGWQGSKGPPTERSKIYRAKIVKEYYKIKKK